MPPVHGRGARATKNKACEDQVRPYETISRSCLATYRTFSSSNSG